MSGINSGTFYDASNLIAANKQYLQEEVSGLVYQIYSLPAGDQEKCKRDLGFLIDAIVYHLRFGGNEKVVNFAQLYYTNRGYPYGEELTYINRTQEETDAAIYAWNQLGFLMTSAMRNTLGAGVFATVDPYVDPTVAADSQFPYCVEVASTIDTYITIVKDIIASGTGVVEVVDQNQNKSGYWSSTPTYTNYNIIGDPLLTAEECNDVISSVDSLYDNLTDVLNLSPVTKSLPDYIDGETKEFDLFWDDGSEVITEEDENLLVTINAVLQQTKYNASYPGEDSYYIDRTVSPNKLVFDVAPIWDQYEGAKTLGEPTAVEKVSAIGIGNYKRLTIEKTSVNNVKTGPFLILDLEDLTVANVEEPDYLLVFIDGVLQKKGTSYRVSGPNIFFEFPVTEQMKIDMRYLYGRDVGQILNIYDYNVDQYYTRSTLTLETTSGLDNFLRRTWMSDKAGIPIQVFQYNQDGSFNIIGQVTDSYSTGNKLIVSLYGNSSELLDSDVYFAVSGRYLDLFAIVGIDYSQSSIEYEKDEVGRYLLSGNDQNWRGTFIRKSYRNPFISLSNNTSIRVEGENNFRRIKELPSVLTSKEQRPQKQVSNSFFGQVNIQSYNGITRGEGLSIFAIMEKDSNGDLTGRIEKLSWNQRSFEPITQPTAYQYYTPPVINFIPENGYGGGAKAKVIVSKGQVLSVELIDPGSGYTEAPRVVVARRYDVLEETDIGVSLIYAGIVSKPDSFNLIISSSVEVLGNQVSGINTFTSILFDSPVDTDRVITSIITPKEEQVSSDLGVGLVEHLSTVNSEREAAPIDTQYNGTEINVYIESPYVVQIESDSTLTTTATREITTTIHNVVQNNALSNINYYEVAAILNVDADSTDTVLYIADTTKFKSNGYLLVGNEVVRYMRKISDRFIMVQRGQNGTTPQAWSAGTFLRQIPDPVSIAPAGVVGIQSEAIVMTLKGGSEIGGSERKVQRQTIAPEIVVTASREIEVELNPQIEFDSISYTQTKVSYRLETGIGNINSVSTIHDSTIIESKVQRITPIVSLSRSGLEFLRIPPPSGVIDRFEESVYISDPIQTRLNGSIDLLDDYGIVKRNGTIIYARNNVYQNQVNLVGDYSFGNAGSTIGSFEGLFDSGTASVSGVSIQEISTYYPSLTFKDFELRSDSSFTLSGDRFMLVSPSIQNPVAVTAYNGTVPTSISVQSTEYFPSSGYLFTSAGSLIQYTDKTSNTFTGCTLVNGPNFITGGDELVPFTIS